MTKRFDLSTPAGQEKFWAEVAAVEKRIAALRRAAENLANNLRGTTHELQTLMTYWRFENDQ